jgi:hypothetical protein
VFVFQSLSSSYSSKDYNPSANIKSSGVLSNIGFQIDINALWAQAGGCEQWFMDVKTALLCFVSQ